MGIYIRGMEMPKTCDDCPLLDWDLSYVKCGVVNRKFNVYEEHFKDSRAYDCPLIETPPHGRLIDADALYEDCALDHGYQVMVTTTRINEYMQLKIDGAPTIIETEGGE